MKVNEDTTSVAAHFFLYDQLQIEAEKTGVEKIREDRAW